MKWAVVLHSEPIVVGPFRSREDAELYMQTDPENNQMEVMEFWPPAKNWKRNTKAA